MKDTYIILTENTAPMLARAVQGKIKDGYEPVGGVSVTVTVSVNIGSTIFAQAMVLAP
jgi:hypothetical protein